MRSSGDAAGPARSKAISCSLTIDSSATRVTGATLRRPISSRPSRCAISICRPGSRCGRACISCRASAAPRRCAGTTTALRSSSTCRGPICRDPAAAGSAERGRASRESRVPNHIEILVVDDEVEVALAVQIMLDEFGYVTSIGHRCRRRRCESLHARRPALVLMDVSMPGTMNGVMLAREVRQIASRLCPSCCSPAIPERRRGAERVSAAAQAHRQPRSARGDPAAPAFAGETRSSRSFPRQARRAR